MFGIKSLSIAELKSALEDLGIHYQLYGADASGTYSFKSLRQVEPWGIYYLADGVEPPPELVDSIVITNQADVGNKGVSIIQVDEPQLAFYRLMQALTDPQTSFFGIHPTAIIGPGCVIGEDVDIGAYCVLEGCFLGNGVRLGPHVTVMAGSDIGTNTVIEAQSTIGATGVAWVWDQNSRERVVQPQTGSVKIGPDCFLGTGITVVRGSVNEATEIGEGSVIAHGSRIGHGCRIGARAHFANNVTLAGNVTLGPECFIAAGATIQPQVRLAERTVVGIGSVVVRNFEEPNCLLAGMPARKIGSAEKVLPGVPLHLRGERS